MEQKEGKGCRVDGMRCYPGTVPNNWVKQRMLGLGTVVQG